MIVCTVSVDSLFYLLTNYAGQPHIFSIAQYRQRNKNILKSRNSKFRVQLLSMLRALELFRKYELCFSVSFLAILARFTRIGLCYLPYIISVDFRPSYTNPRSFVCFSYRAPQTGGRRWWLTVVLVIRCPRRVPLERHTTTILCCRSPPNYLPASVIGRLSCGFKNCPSKYNFTISAVVIINLNQAT